MFGLFYAGMALLGIDDRLFGFIVHRSRLAGLLSELEHLTTGQAVKLYRRRFSRKTILRWCEDGWIAGACQQGPGGRWSIPAPSLDRFVGALAHKRRRL